MGLISKIKEAVKNDKDEDNSSVDAASNASVVNEPASSAVAGAKASASAEVKETTSSSSAADVATPSSGSRADMEAAVTAAADRAAAENVHVVQGAEKEVKEVGKTVDDVQLRAKEAVLQEREDVHERVEVQPEVRRDVEETEVRQVVQPVVDKQNVQTEESTTLPGQHREVVADVDAEASARYKSQAGQYQSSSETGAITGETIVNAPHIQETHKKHIINEIQPVIQREIDHTHVVKTTQPISEHVVAAAKVAELQINAPISIEEFNAKSGTKDFAARENGEVQARAAAAADPMSNRAAAAAEAGAGAEATTLREI